MRRALLASVAAAVIGVAAQAGAQPASPSAPADVVLPAVKPVQRAIPDLTIPLPPPPDAGSRPITGNCQPLGPPPTGVGALPASNTTCR